ncbi:hypothetical protein [Candidatus Erwinia dacicola]|uniref:Uncharacterized protein n=1 Tax=Candidatus Erwinia dacicola TaxID=252393 RepID=A0A328TIH8_9GAMM|nr:hypothetical protein [Candidatus Erwinia dacicola]RAP70427.1 hypothetical protein ACZ87_02766 [Candidatus Erwinia dacicola]
MLEHKQDSVIPLVLPGSAGDDFDDEDDGLVFTSAAQCLRAMGEK